MELLSVLSRLESDEHRDEFDSLAGDIYSLVEELYPICRSITGDGLRETLQIIKSHLDIDIHEVPTGTRVFDWEIPREWRIRDAYIADSSGQKVVDFQESNLHVLNYSSPIRETMDLEELKGHLHSLPDKPDWIPYRTSYYNENWGFCLTHRQLESLKPGTYTVVIDSELFDGSLSYGEYLVPGETADEVLFFAHCCHPSLCNDNLSGIAMLVFLGKILNGLKLRHSVRLIFAPATIGSITWLARNKPLLPNIKAGLVASVLGDKGHFRYKVSREGDALIDRVCQLALAKSGVKHEILPFSPWGYDERQFCSPGIKLPVGRLTRSPNGEYPEYHTSADNLDLVGPKYLAGSLIMYLNVIAGIECNRTYTNTRPDCEPQLGRRGLYREMGGFQDLEDGKLAMLWMLNQSDGDTSLLEIAESSGMDYQVLHQAAAVLEEHELLA